jgi:hypothetical protein
MSEGNNLSSGNPSSGENDSQLALCPADVAKPLHAMGMALQVCHIHCTVFVLMPTIVVVLARFLQILLSPLDSVRTAEDAARTMDCAVQSIVKSIGFSVLGKLAFLSSRQLYLRASLVS